MLSYTLRRVETGSEPSERAVPRWDESRNTTSFPVSITSVCIFSSETESEAAVWYRPTSSAPEK